MQRLNRWLRFNLMYLGKPPWDTGISPPELLDFIQRHPPGRAIDLGCGSGTNLLTLAKAGWQVTGVDFAIKAVRAARRKLAAAGLPGEVRAGDVTRLKNLMPKKGPGYDLALDIGCYHGLAEERRPIYRQNLEQILTPGGYFLIFVHWKPDNPGKAHGITQADLDAFNELFTLENRQDSQDNNRPATWLWLVRPR